MIDVDLLGCAASVQKIIPAARLAVATLRNPEEASRRFSATDGATADDARGAEAVLAREGVGERKRNGAAVEARVVGGHLQVVQGVNCAEGRGPPAGYNC